jgi:hypothetical protein
MFQRTLPDPKPAFAGNYTMSAAGGYLSSTAPGQACEKGFSHERSCESTAQAAENAETAWGDKPLWLKADS